MASFQPHHRTLSIVAIAVGLGSLGCEQVLGAGTGVDRVEPSAVRSAIGGSDAALVIDVRDRREYEAAHIPGALAIPFDGVDGFFARTEVSKDKPVVVVCAHGRLSILAAASVRAGGFGNVRSLAGGIQRWQAEGNAVEPGPGNAVPPDQLKPPFMPLSKFEQVIVVVTGIVIKPVYMLLALVVALWLRRSKDASVVLVRRGMLAFFAGEAFCALDWMVGRWSEVHPIDLLHGAGMVAMGVLAPWGLFRILDDRFLHFANPADRCTVQRFCGHCWKREAVSCAPHNLFLLAAPALGVLALVPLCGPILSRHWESQVFLSSETYGVPIINQLIEWRLFPILGALLMLLTVFRLRGGPASIQRAQLPFFGGFGLLSYALFRFLLHNTFQGPLFWSDFWEEVTELLAVLTIALFLWFFRVQLGLTKEHSHETA